MKARTHVALLITLLVTAGCASGRRSAPLPSAQNIQAGLASWYGQEFAGRLTANGETFDPMLLTAAHRTLPFGTVLLVRNPQNGKSVEVRVNDRGPFIGNRMIDLSYAAAARLDLVRIGVGPVEMSVLTLGSGQRSGFAIAKSSPASERRDPDKPPTVEFPLPSGTTLPAQPVEESDFRVEVVEEVKGEVVQKKVSDDGQSIERIPVPSSPPATAASAPRLESNPTRKTGFAVQLGSFQQESNARALQAKISPSVGGVFVDVEGTLHRVRVGPFATRTEAIEARERLEAAGFSGFIVHLR